MKAITSGIALIPILLFTSRIVLAQALPAPPAASNLQAEPSVFSQGTAPAAREPRPAESPVGTGSPGSEGLRAESGLPNFHRINANLLRGGQPATAGIARLKQLGVRTILNLRQPDRFSRVEEDQARAAGIRYYAMPMKNFFRPSPESMAAVLKLLDDPGNWPVYVHCLHGSDRTGTVVACYRISHEDWTADKAIAEALDYGMSGFEYLKRSFIRHFYRSRQEPGLLAATAVHGPDPDSDDAPSTPSAPSARNASKAGAL